METQGQQWQLPVVPQKAGLRRWSQSPVVKTRRRLRLAQLDKRGKAASENATWGHSEGWGSSCVPRVTSHVESRVWGRKPLSVWAHTHTHTHTGFCTAHDQLHDGIDLTVKCNKENDIIWHFQDFNLCNIHTRKNSRGAKRYKNWVWWRGLWCSTENVWIKSGSCEDRDPQTSGERSPRPPGTSLFFILVSSTQCMLGYSASRRQ